MNARQRGELALLSAAILYGLLGIFSKAINFQIPIFYQSWVRNIIIVVFLGILMVVFKKWKRVTGKDAIWMALRSACGFVSFITIYVAFTKLDIATTYFLSYAATVVSGYGLGVLVFKEKLKGKGILALLLAIGGLVFVYRVTFSTESVLFAVLAIISGLTGPGWNAFSKQISSRYSNLQLNFLDTIGAFAFPFVCSLILREQWIPITLSSVWIYTFLFGLMFLITAFLIVYGFSKVSAQAGILILLFEIIAGIFFGYLFYKEIPSIGSIIGGVLIVASIFLRSSDPEVV